MTWLLTGGAGYIGGHIAHALKDAGLGVVVLDDLSSGLPSRVPEGVPLVSTSVLDADRVSAALREHRVTGVVHLAAKKAAGESVEQPLRYYRENVTGFERLLTAMGQAGVGRIVFSSSAAVYGSPDTELVTEESPTVPVSPYGESKLIGEWLLRDLARAAGLSWVSLRYFNVAGAGAPHLGDTGVFNLIPMVFQALARGERPKVFGDDYSTPDGSCVRDYIDVVDLADAHLAAARRLEGAGPVGEVYNVGRGEGVSVKEVLEVVRRVTGNPFPHDVVARRPGDPARIVASAEKIGRDLGWHARRDLEEMVASAWQAWQARQSEQQQKPQGVSVPAG
ncbi:MAG: UDP-glucose 4-epimerase GalE [Actinomycetota bacterium]|nr:UDP-glucose 4-epimerase GalE [Actinomycetota bacterium]